MTKAISCIDSVLNRVFDAISKVLQAVGILGMVGIMLMLVTQTIMQWFSVSILWSDEVVSVLNIWLVFMAATVVDREDKHVQVTFITDKLPCKVRLLLEIIIGVLCIYAMFIIFRGGLVYIARTQNIKTNILRLPSVALYTSPLIGLCLMGIMRVWNVIKNLFFLFTGKTAEDLKGEQA